MTTRRQFLSDTASWGSAALLAALPHRGLFAKSVGQAGGRPIGIQLWTVNDVMSKDSVGTLKQLKAIGYSDVEVFSLAGKTAQEFRSLLDSAGLRCPSMHFLFDEKSMRIYELDEMFGFAHTLGAQYIVAGALFAYVHREELAKLMKEDPKKAGVFFTTIAMDADEAKREAEIANKIGEQAKKAGLQFAYHNHNFEFEDIGNGLTGYDILLRETDPDLVKFELDCGWMSVGGKNPIDYFKRYPGRFPLAHIKDFAPAPAGANPHRLSNHPGAELGHGTIDYKPILPAAYASGVKYALVEQEGPFERMSSMEAARVDFGYLRSAIKGLVSN